MLIGVVSDVHCNAATLDAALSDMDDAGVGSWIAAGDLIFEYKFSNAVVRTVRERGMLAVQGNHEMTFLGPHGVRARASAGVDQREVETIAAWPFEVRTVVGGLSVHLTHGSPWPPHYEYLYPDSPKLAGVESLGVDLLVMGHTHVPLVRRVGRTLVVNPGSLGLKRGSGAEFTYAVIDTDERDAEIRSVPDPTLEGL